MQDFVKSLAVEWANFAYWKYFIVIAISFTIISLMATIASYAVAKYGESKMRAFGYNSAFAVWLIEVAIQPMFFDGLLLLAIFAILTPLVAAFIVVQTFNAMIRSTQRKADWSLKSCLKVKAAVLRKFEQFDQDQDGDLSQKDIITSMASDRISREDQFVLQYLLDRLENIGHDIGKEERIVPMPIPGMPIGVIPTKMDVTVYAINRKDIVRWPSKVKRSFENWSVSD